MEIEMKTCSICGKNIDIQYNAQPINDGTCCSECNMTIVLPTRLKQAMEESR